MWLLRLLMPMILWMSAISKNVLLIGDSVDRYIVSAWCSYKDAMQHATSWGDGSIKYGDKTKQPSLLCRSLKDNITLASLHIFGSSPYGPYLWVENVRDKLANTVPRIEKALQLYENQIGAPDIVIFQSILWDLRPLSVSGDLEYMNHTSPEWNTTLQAFKKNTQDRIEDIIKLTKHTRASIGVRTQPRVKGGWMIMHAMNEFIRAFAEKKRLVIYDYDADVWCGHEHHSINLRHSILRAFRDGVHPNVHFSAIAGAKLVGEQYTLFLQVPQHNHQSNITQDFNGSLFSSNTKSNALNFVTLECLHYRDGQIVAILVSTRPYFNPFSFTSLPSDILYFAYCDENNSRVLWNISVSILLHLNLGPGDLFHLQPDSLSGYNKSILKYETMLFPSLFLKRWHYDDDFVVEAGGALFVKVTHGCHNLASPRQLHLFNKSTNDIYHVHGNQAAARAIMRNFLPCTLASIDERYSNGTLVRVKAERQVYILIDGYRVAIPGLAVFTKYGYDFSQVVIFDDSKMLDFIPIREGFLE